MIWRAIGLHYGTKFYIGSIKMIQISENLVKVLRDNTLNALAMFDNAKEPSSISFDEYQNFYQAKVFLQKFKMDGWIMCRQIWEAVWGEMVKDLNIKNREVTYLDTPEKCFDLTNDKGDCSVFMVSYEVNKKFQINLAIVLYWQEQKLGLYSSINNQDDTEFPIMQTPTELTAIKDDYNASQYTVSLKNSGTVSDTDIAHLRQFAQEIISYFNQHQQEILNNLK